MVWVYSVLVMLAQLHFGLRCIMFWINSLLVMLFFFTILARLLQRGQMCIAHIVGD